MIIDIPSQVNTALEILCAAGHSAYVVGGAVRDAVMGRQVHDWDIASSALPEETERLFFDYRVIETGIKHGTVTVIIDGMSIEITTFRIDGDYSDNRRPDSVVFTGSIADDLSRRDFTCNAVAYSPREGFVDPFSGLEDIENRVIRCVGNPDKRFNEDALRILRALRFTLTLGFECEKETAKSVHKNRALLRGISVERKFSELYRLIPYLTADFGDEYSDVLFEIIPELRAEKGCAQNHPRHIFDVWMHSLTAVENCPPEPEIRIAALLHDIGKPACKTTDENGIDHFYGHGNAGAVMTEKIMKRLKTSGKITRHVTNLVKHHDFQPHLISDKTYRRYIGEFGEDFIRELFAVREADVRAQSPEYLEQSLAENREGRERFERIVKTEHCFKITDLAVTGRELAAAGIEPGPAMGEVLNRLFEKVLSRGVANERELLLAEAAEIYTQIKGNNYGNS